MAKYKKHLKGEIGFTDKLSAVKETCGQSLWILVFVVLSVVVSSIVGLVLDVILMFIVNLILGLIGFVVGGFAIRRVRKFIKLK